MLPAGLQPAISVGERPQTHALDRAATGTGIAEYCMIRKQVQISLCLATESSSTTALDIPVGVQTTKRAEAKTNVSTPAGDKDFYVLQRAKTGSGAHFTSYSTGAVCSFTTGLLAGA